MIINANEWQDLPLQSNRLEEVEYGDLVDEGSTLWGYCYWANDSMVIVQIFRDPIAYPFYGGKPPYILPESW